MDLLRDANKTFYEFDENKFFHVYIQGVAYILDLFISITSNYCRRHC